MPEVIVAENPEELNHIAADRFVTLANTAIASNGRFTVALAGGSTPKSLYRLLSSDKYKNQINWTNVFLFFGDERFVPPDSPESNYRMARENLIDLIDIPAENVLRWFTEIGSPVQTAIHYEKAIRIFFASEALPRFDLILLGLGADGHTASLFPDSPALSETKRLAISNHVEKLDTYRLTFTFHLINSAANVIFLVAGEEKAPVIAEILGENPSPGKYPAQMVKPSNGKLKWLLDKKASAELTIHN